MLSGIRPDDKVAILPRLEPVIGVLYEAGEFASLKAREFFAAQTMDAARRKDGHLFPMLVRFFVRSYLQEHGHAAEIDQQWLPNCGVAFAYDIFEIRFLKSYFGRLPAPGRSRVKRAFYNQDIEGSLWEENDRSFDRVNLVITWDVDDFGNLAVLVVYSPCGGGVASDSARSFWFEVFQHPASTYEPPPPEEVEEPGEDLDIGLDHPDTETLPEDDAGQDLDTA